jgi:hypothetical protein
MVKQHFSMICFPFLSLKVNDINDCVHKKKKMTSTTKPSPFQLEKRKKRKKKEAIPKHIFLSHFYAAISLNISLSIAHANRKLSILSTCIAQLIK